MRNMSPHFAFQSMAQKIALSASANAGQLRSSRIWSFIRDISDVEWGALYYCMPSRPSQIEAPKQLISRFGAIITRRFDSTKASECIGSQYERGRELPQIDMMKLSARRLLVITRHQQFGNLDGIESRTFAQVVTRNKQY